MPVRGFIPHGQIESRDKSRAAEERDRG